jgi:hypothetical protein
MTTGDDDNDSHNITDVQENSSNEDISDNENTNETNDLSKCKSKYTYLIDDDGKACNIVSNYGLKKYEKCFVERKGEYHGFCIEAQENIPSILTNKHISNSINFIKQNKIDKAATEINLYSKYQLFGDELVYYVIDEWLKINKFDTMFETKVGKDFLETFNNNDEKKNIDLYIRTQRHHPLLGKIKIVDIGTNTKTKESVVPSDWINKIFDSAYELHGQMSTLPNRKGKKPVTYCCIYSNSIKRETIWISEHKILINDIVFSVQYNNEKKYITTNTKKIQKEYISEQQLIKLNSGNNVENMYLSIDSKLIKTNKKYIKQQKVGYLSSLLQKTMRRGANNGTLLESVIRLLNASPNYNLPDHNFVSVSGARQLLWRSYISIIEDVKGYIVPTNNNEEDSRSNCIDLQSMTLLAIACQQDSKIQLSKDCVNIIIETMRIMQVYDKLWCWRDYEPTLTSELLLSNNNNDNNQILDSIVLSINNMPMMANDKNMLLRVYSYVINNKIETFRNIKNIYTPLSDEEQDNNEHFQTRLAAMDMHCRPKILIELQAMIDLKCVINSNNLLKYAPTLERLSGYIWNNVSRTNFRMMTSHTLLFSDKEIKRDKLDKIIVKKLDNSIYACIPKLQESILNEMNNNDKKNICMIHDRVDWSITFNNKFVDNVETIDETERNMIGRKAWLLLFGKRHKFNYKSKVYDVFMGGSDKENLLKVKRTTKDKTEYVEGELRKDIQDKFLESISEKEFKIKLPNAPDNYGWNFNETKNNTIVIKYNKQKFAINGYNVTTLNLFENLKRIPDCLEYDGVPEELEAIIKSCTYCINNDFENIFDEELLFRMEDIIYYRRDTSPDSSPGLPIGGMSRCR